mmetsp:Transcript_60610/g.74289  ORF Transcript_60610/g.74289 Transcript_60610/m.74289 type:complete len:359 (+) Transcript_60610:1189-2265(+)
MDLGLAHVLKVCTSWLQLFVRPSVPNVLEWQELILFFQLKLVLLTLLLRVGTLKFLELFGILHLHVSAPLLQQGKLLLSQGTGQVVDTLAFRFALSDLVLTFLQHLRLTRLLDLVETDVGQIIRFDLCDLLASHLEVGGLLLSLFLHLFQHLHVLLQLSFLLALLLLLDLSALSLFFLPLAFLFRFQGFLSSLFLHGLAFLHLLAALAFLLTPFDLLLSLTNGAGLLFHQFLDVAQELLFLVLVVPLKFLLGHTLHRILELVTDLDERLPHALHVHLGGCSKDDGLLHVVDLDADALLARGIGHPGFCNVEWHNGCSVFEVFDGHADIHLRELLDEPEEDDLLQRHHVILQLSFAHII